jgi:retron-type reverse transcriptase
MNLPLLQAIFSLRTLRRALRSAMRRPRLRREAYQMFPTAADRDEYLCRLKDEIKDGRYVPATARTGSVPHPNDNHRCITYEVLGLREWLVERCVRDALAGLYEPIFAPTSCAYRRFHGEEKLKSLATAAMADGRVWFACADIARCFASVNLRALVAEIRAFTADDSVAALVGLCVGGGLRAGLPLGHVLSPFLLNVYLHPIDSLEDLQPVLRFSDDFFLPRYTQEHAEHALARLEDVLDARGFAINPAKRRIICCPDAASLLHWVPES